MLRVARTPPEGVGELFAGGEAPADPKMAGAPGGDNERISSDFRTPHQTHRNPKNKDLRRNSEGSPEGL